MDNDDMLVGRLLSRREVLAMFGVAGAALVVGCSDTGPGKPAPTSGATEALTGDATQAATSAVATNSVPSCVVRPAETEGPYFVDEKLNRSDIRADPTDGTVKDGVPLVLTFMVSEVGSGSSCSPLANATVDVWHCDALGVYSGVSDNAQGFNTVGKKFLRGYQVTDASGKAQFTTIYPGWYQGRTVHIHFKIRTQSGKSREFTSQLFFDEDVSDLVYARAPYNLKGQRSTRNANDMVYQGGGGQLLLDLTPSGDGYAATFDIGLQN
ncbi:MAG: intradiol ring-cleavage dioxygenase [Chloroflexota bacterium]|nr:intradiol ring-cleavage dioxygenase [Chloroflexota bacterium]